MGGRKDGRTDRMFQSNMVSQKEYSSTKHSVSRNIPAQNILPAGICQSKVFSQQDVPLQSVQSAGYSSPKHSVSRDIPVQNIQSVGIFQHKID
jgi:hypothetical protein